MTDWNFIHMSFEEWVEKYKPEMDAYGNPVSYQEIPDGTNPFCVWTRVCDEDEVIQSGFHWVNRIDHYISEIPYMEEDIVTVHIEQEVEE